MMKFDVLSAAPRRLRRSMTEALGLLVGELPTNRLGGLVDPGFLNGIFVGVVLPVF